MGKISIPIIVVTLFMLLYNVLPIYGAEEHIIIPLFILSPVAVLWMVYRILKYGTPSDKTWDEHFYEDHPYRRNGKE